MFTSVVAGTDGSDTAQAAMAQAAGLTARLGARLLIVSAYQPVSAARLRSERRGVPDDAQWMVGPQEDVLALLDDAASAARAAGVEQVETFARQGDAADAIVAVADEQHADLIIVGNRGMTGAKRFVLGSVPNTISHSAPCSVLIVKTS